MMKYVDRFLDQTTMYALLVYYLAAILGAALLLGAFGVLPYSPLMLGASAGFLLLVSWVVNYGFEYVYGTRGNGQSTVITALILALIITPPASLKGFTFLAAAAGLAVASKYILAYRYRHIFNPAAIAVVLTAFGPQETASWWVGTAALTPIVAIGGYLLVRKLRHEKMVGIFIGVALLLTLVTASFRGASVSGTLQTLILHSSLLFLAFVMLTEPMTSPTSRKWQLVFAAIVGVLFVPTLHIGSIYTTPELALVLGNSFAFLVTPKVKTAAAISRRETNGRTAMDVFLRPERSFSYVPGQFVELTIPHEHPDNRGSRRHFTLASSPTEPLLHIGMRLYDNGSTYKQVFARAEAPYMTIGQLGGDFVLPSDTNQPLVFIAGGIGITPFRSMMKYLLDTGQRRDVTLLYAEKSAQDFLYRDVFDAAEAAGMNVRYVVTDEAVTDTHYLSGRLTDILASASVSLPRGSMYYISGPQPMVTAVKATLRSRDIPRGAIKTDYFSGYA